MSQKSFDELFREAEGREEYWIELAKLEVTEAIFRRMNQLGLSRSELAERLDTSPAYVTKVLKGDANFTLATLVKLARALECEVRLELKPTPAAVDSATDHEKAEAA